MNGRHNRKKNLWSNEIFRDSIMVTRCIGLFMSFICSLYIIDYFKLGFDEFNSKYNAQFIKILFLISISMYVIGSLIRWAFIKNKYH